MRGHGYRWERHWPDRSGAHWHPQPPWVAARRGGTPRPRPPRPLLVVVLAAVQLAGCLAAESRGRGDRPLDALGYLLILAGPAAFAIAGRWRRTAVLLSVAAVTGYAVLGYPPGPVFLAAVLVVVGAVQAGHRKLAWDAVAAGWVAWVWLGRWTGLPDLSRPAAGDAAMIAAWIVVGLSAGEALRIRHAQLAAVARTRAEQERAQQASRRAVAEEQRASAELERRRASEERLRIARELHDVLGHHLSLISVQANVGLHLLDDRPEQARESLSAIKQASAEALREVRAVLGALRPQDESAPRTPARGLADLPALVAEVTAAGLPVELRVDEVSVPVASDVERAAFRVVQEALTNVRRHAGAGARAQVRVAHQDGRLTVRVRNSGAAGAGPDRGDPGDGGPADGGPADGDPGDGGPADGGPGDGGPGDGGPGDGRDLAGRADPAEGGPVASGPGDGGPVDGGPADGGPAEGGPGDGGPGDGGPGDGGPGDGGPVDGGPGDGGPVDGGPGDGGPSGAGIPGMRERVAALGGHFTAAPSPGGGFEVYAELPTPEAT